MIINHNISALNAWRNYSSVDNQMTKSLEKLSSGYRINRAADDAAGLAISEKMRSIIGGLNVAIKNAQDGISFIQTAEGALNEVHSILQRMRDLAAQSKNGINSATNRSQLNAEYQELLSEIDRIGNTTQFNDQKIFDGSLGNITLQIGALASQTLTVTVSTVNTTTLNINGTNITTSTLAGAAMDAISAAIDTLSSTRGYLGAIQNRLEHTIANLGVTAENLTAAESRIRDVDMAKEMATFTKQQILLQAGTAMMAQANMKSQSVLKLLG